MADKTKMTVSEMIVVIVLGLAEIPLDGFVFSRLWLWFVVPVGAAAIGIMSAAGIILTARYITSKRKSADLGTFDECLSVLWHTATFAATCFALGYVIHRCAR